MPRILKLSAFPYGQMVPLNVGVQGFLVNTEKSKTHKAVDFLFRLLTSVMLGLCSSAHSIRDDFKVKRFLMLVKYGTVVLPPVIAINGLTIQNG